MFPHHQLEAPHLQKLVTYTLGLLPLSSGGKVGLLKREGEREGERRERKEREGKA